MRSVTILMTPWGLFDAMTWGPFDPRTAPKRIVRVILEGWPVTFENKSFHGLSFWEKLQYQRHLEKEVQPVPQAKKTFTKKTPHGLCIATLALTQEAQGMIDTMEAKGFIIMGFLLGAFLLGRPGDRDQLMTYGLPSGHRVLIHWQHGAPVFSRTLLCDDFPKTLEETKEYIQSHHGPQALSLLHLDPPVPYDVPRMITWGVGRLFHHRPWRWYGVPRLGAALAAWVFLMASVHSLILYNDEGGLKKEVLALQEKNAALRKTVDTHPMSQPDQKALVHCLQETLAHEKAMAPPCHLKWLLKTLKDCPKWGKVRGLLWKPQEQLTLWMAYDTWEHFLHHGKILRRKNLGILQEPAMNDQTPAIVEVQWTVHLQNG